MIQNQHYHPSNDQHSIRDARYQQRLELPGAAGYPGEDELQYLAQMLGGAIVVESPDSMEQFQDPQTYGSGRPVLTLKHDFMDPANKVGAHFWIRQMWQ